MSVRLLPFTLCLTILTLAGSASAATKSGASKSAAPVAHRTTGQIHKKKSHAGYRRSSRVGLVPPPPAYMPSILPELYYRGNAAEEEEDEEEVVGTAAVPAKPKNPYAKYFYSRDNVVPKAMKARSGVTTWSQNQSGNGVTTWSR